MVTGLKSLSLLHTTDIYKKKQMRYKVRNASWQRWSIKAEDIMPGLPMKFPFPMGPYKFAGLPGLIVKIEDKKSNIPGS
jgi:hypothetical protein